MAIEKQKTLSPKKMEIRERPGRILSIARTIMKKEGYSALTIDRVAKELNCSRPPIYEIFDSREDIVMGLAIEDSIQRWEMLKKAITFQGRTREKLMAMNEFFGRVYPEHLKILAVIQPNFIRQKADKKNLKTFEEYEARAFDLGIRAVEQAVDVGDLVIEDDLSGAMIAYPVLCLAFGGNTFESRYPYWPLKQRDFDRELAYRWGFRAMMDGFNWKPLSSEWDYGNTAKRIHAELDIFGYIEKTENEKPSRLYESVTDED